MSGCCKPDTGVPTCHHGHVAVLAKRKDGWTEERAPACCPLCGGRLLQTYVQFPAPKPAAPVRAPFAPAEASL